MALSYAGVVELADTADLRSAGLESHTGSSPVFGTIAADPSAMLNLWHYKLQGRLLVVSGSSFLLAWRNWQRTGFVTRWLGVQVPSLAPFFRHLQRTKRAGFGLIAQMVEHLIDNPKVSSSSLDL